MKALCKIHPGAGGVVLKNDVPVPEPGPDEVRIQVYYTGICGTDIHIMHDEFNCVMPRVIGHEFSGVIDKAGEDVTGFAKGDRVVSMTAAHYCGKCEYCRKGYWMLCNEKRGLGSGHDGTFAEYFIMKADRFFHIPEGISMQEAALSEPVCCTIRGAVERTDIKAGDYVYVAGPGTIGQLVAQLAKLSGAHVTVAGTAVDKDRLALAKATVADEIIDVSAEDPLERAMEITKGDLYDVVFECSGAAPSAAACLDVVKKTGWFSQVGLYGKPVPFDMDKALFKECRITNTYSSERTSWTILMRLLEQGRLDLRPYISAVMPLDDWKSAFDMAERKEGYKILLKCSDFEE